MPITNTDRPKLRWPLETEQFEHEGKPYLVLRDQHLIAKEPALVPAACVSIVARFDGVLSIAEIAKLANIPPEFVLQLAEELERMSFLETPETLKAFSELQQGFLALPVRPPSLSGLVYSAEPEILIKELRGFIEQAGTSVRPEAEIAGIMSPHIDYRRGGLTYGSAYGALAAAKKPDVIILIGTSHFGGESMYQLSKKDFASPLGTLPAAQQALRTIANAYGEERAYRDEYYHRREHSLELQLPFLTYRFRDEGMPEIVPVLVGSFHRFLTEMKSPLEDQEVVDFIGGLSEAIRSLKLAGRRVLFYAGVDLAHMGRHFGDKEHLSSTALPKIEERDRALLQTLLSADENALFEHMAEDCDQRRICGFPSLYTMLATARKCSIELKGHLLEYRQAAEPRSDTIVTFASLYWVA